MLNATIKIDATEVLAAFARVQDQAMVDRIAQAVTTEVRLPRLSAAQYPAASGAKQPFVSDKQRRYFFAALHRGEITVPYRRSGALGAAENWQQIPASDGLTLRSTRKYGALVRGAADQAKYHRGTWPTDEDIVIASEDQAAQVATVVVIDAIGDAGP